MQIIISGIFLWDIHGGIKILFYKPSGDRRVIKGSLDSLGLTIVGHSG